MMRFSSPGPTKRQHTRRFRSGPGRENAYRHEEYATVKATLANRTDKAVLLSRDDLIAAVWVPKVKLAISSRIAADREPLKTAIALQVDLAFALEHKLV